MSTWHALYYPLRPGSEETVKGLFRLSGRPEHVMSDDGGRVVGRLLGTMAFVGRELAVRVVEVDGPLGLVAAHLNRQEPIREFERQLGDHLTVPRDMSTPAAARAFFRDAAMECVLVSRHDQPPGRS